MGNSNNQPFVYPEKEFLAFSADPVRETEVSKTVLRMSPSEIEENRKRFLIRYANGHQIKALDTKLNKDIWGTYQDAHAESNDKVFVPNIKT